MTEKKETINIHELSWFGESIQDVKLWVLKTA